MKMPMLAVSMLAAIGVLYDPFNPGLGRLSLRRAKPTVKPAKPRRRKVKARAAVRRKANRRARVAAAQARRKAPQSLGTQA